MNQYEKLIMKESMKICEQLSSSEIKEGGYTSFRGKSPTKDSVDFGTIKPLKRATDAIWAILLISIALIIHLLFIIEGLYRAF